MILAACGKAPDLIIDDMEVFYNGHQRLDGQLQIALPIIKKEALAKAKSVGKENELLSQWNIVIEFKDYPVECGPVKAAGCQDPYNLGTFYVGWEPKVTNTVLVGEMAHLVWEVCYNKTGENDNWVNNKPVQTLDSDYQNWFEMVNQEIKDKLGY